MSNAHPIVGSVFGLWVVIGDAGRLHGVPHWKCRCECGTERVVNSQSLRRGLSRSCSCLKAKHPNHFIHGLSGTVIEEAWHSMLGRCYRKTNPKFHRWGGRGIVVCEFLRVSPLHILSLIGEKPSPKLSLGRINNDGMYSCGRCADCLQHEWPLNVRWETAKEQARNRSTSRFFTIDGVTKTIAEWCENTGIAKHNFTRRIARGLNPITNSK